MLIEGYVVFTKQSNGRWLDDWDGNVHPTLAEGEEALALSRDFLATIGEGEDPCILVECRRVGGEDAVDRDKIVAAIVDALVAPNGNPDLTAFDFASIGEIAQEATDKVLVALGVTNGE